MFLWEIDFSIRKSLGSKLFSNLKGDHIKFYFCLVQSQSENDLSMVSLLLQRSIKELARIGSQGPTTCIRSTFSKTSRLSSPSYMKGGKEGQEVKFYVRTAATDNAGTTE